MAGTRMHLNTRGEAAMWFRRQWAALNGGQPTDEQVESWVAEFARRREREGQPFEPDHPTPPAPGEARGECNVCLSEIARGRMPGPPNASDFVSVGGMPVCRAHVGPRDLLTEVDALRARAEAAERARDEMAERVRKQFGKAYMARERAAAAEAHVARLTDALRAFTQPAGPVAEQPCEWVGTYCRTHDEWESCRYGIARAALAPAPEPTPTETDR